MEQKMKFKLNEKLQELIKVFIIMIALTFLICIPYLNKEPISSHDISYHLNRIVEISNELKNGQFPVLIHSNLQNGFGYANPLFYPELFLYIPAILICFGISALTSCKLFIIISTFFTILITYYSANLIFKKKNISWIVTLLYSTALYRLTDIYVRGALGEVLSMIFLPLILAGVYEIIFGDNEKWWILCFGIFGIANSHVLTLAITVAFILFVCLINVKKIFKNKKIFINLLKAGVISILLICSFVLPYLEQSANDTYNVDKNNVYITLSDRALTFKQLISNNVLSDDGGNSGNFESVGLILFVLPFFIFKCKNKDNKFVKQLFIIDVLLIFVSTKLFPWDWLGNHISFIKIFQFPFRINVLTSVVASFVSGYVICDLIDDKKELNNLVYVLLILFSLTTISKIDPNSKGCSDLNDVLTYSPLGNAEYQPYGLDMNDKVVHNVNSDEEIEFTRTGSKIEFYYDDTENEMTIHIPLAYYTGYTAYIEDENGEKTKLNVTEDEETKNVIVSSDEIKTGKITVEYKMTIIGHVSYFITWVTMILLVIYIFYHYKRIKKLTK
jgi:hypothetical protein